MEKIICYSCSKQKHKLEVKKSSILPINLFMCETCIENKFEPRWVIILAARQNEDPSVVRDFIVKRRYVGKDISGSELIV